MAVFAVEVGPAAIAKAREHELEEARNLQRAMVPAEPLRAQRVEITSRFRPADGVGGDFLDYFALADRTLGLYVGDVVGKGLPAALYAALVVGTLRGIHKTGSPPAQVLELLNKRLRMRVVGDRFCAAQYAVFDPTSRALHYTNAGLPGPLHVSPRGCRELKEGGVPAGLFEDARYEAQRVQLEPGDAILFMTDGLNEAQSPGGEEFGMERLLEVCAAFRSGPAQTLLHHVFAAVDGFVGEHPQHDDMTAVVLKLDDHGA